MHAPDPPSSSANRRRGARGARGGARWSRALARCAVASIGAGAEWKHGLSLFGDLKYPADFKQFDYVNAECAEGRRGAADGVRHLRQLQHGGGRREGLARRRHRAHLRHADGGGARRGVDRVRAARRGGQPSGGSFLRHLSAARQCQVARRQAGDRRRRDLLVRRLQEQPSAVFGLLQPRHQGGEDRRARGHIHVRRRPAIANCRRSSASSTCCRSIGGRAPTRPATSATSRRPRSSRRSAAAPIGSRSSCPAAPSFSSASPTIGARTSTSTSAATTSTSMRFEYFRDSTVAIEAFKADAIDWRTENSAKNWATAYDFPAVKDKRVVQGGIPDPVLRRHAGLRLQHPPAEIRRSARAPRLQLRAQFRGDEQADVLRPVQAHRKATSRAWSWRRADCRRAPSSRSWKPCATRCRRRCSPRPTPTRSTTTPMRCAPICARRRGLLREAGYEVRGQKLVNAKTGEPLTVEMLIDQPEWERLVLPYKPPLERLGIQMSLRIVDDAQYENRLRQWDYDMIVATWGQSLSPGNEQRGFWSSKAADQAGLAQSGRHQESGRRRADRAADLREEPRRSRRRHQGARPRAAVEFLRRAAMDLRQGSQRPLGSFRPSRSAAEIRLLRIPDGVVVGSGQGREGGIALVTGLSRRNDSVIGAGAVASGAVGLKRWAQAQPVEDAERHGMSSFGDLKYPADFPAFRLRRSQGAQGRRCFRRSARARSTIRTRSPSIRSTATSCAATPRRAWS